MPTITAYGTIQKGVLTLSNRRRLEEDLRRMKDCNVELTIKKKNRRSNPQNRYLWGVVYKEIEVKLNDWGNDVDCDDLHEYFKAMFLKQPICNADGEMIGEIAGSSAVQNKEDFGIYIEKIRQWAAENIDLYIPDPNADLTLNF